MTASSASSTSDKAAIYHSSASSGTKKLTPAERLMRKRAAARLRQQRCRARKREAQLEQGRKEKSKSNAGSSGAVATDIAASPPSSKSKVDAVTSHVTPKGHRNSPEIFPPPHLVAAEPRFDHRQHYGGQPQWYNQRRSTPSPIYNCISFDSQRSYDEPHRYGQFAPYSVRREGGVTTPEPVGTSAMVSPAASSRKTVVSLSSTPSSEEAAVAAMLSLKSGGSSPVRSSVSRPVPVLPPMTDSQQQQWANWEADRRYTGSATSYPQHQHQVPGQWNIPHRYTPNRNQYSSSLGFFQPMEMYGV